MVFMFSGGYEQKKCCGNNGKAKPDRKVGIWADYFLITLAPRRRRDLFLN